MTKVIVTNNPSKKELSEMLKVEQAAWPEEQAFTAEHFQSHFEVFPEGIFIAKVDGVMAGVGITQIMDYDLNKPVPTWYEVTDKGFIRKTHNSNGNVFYGVSLSVSPAFSAESVGLTMLHSGMVFVEKHNLECFVIGSRMPRYHKHTNMDACKYAFKQRSNGRYIDPEVEFYHKVGFTPVSVLPGYFEDPESMNNGVLMIWRP